MHSYAVRFATGIGVLALVNALVLPGTGTAQTTSGKIVCWKDKAGKVIGCGDKVPPEYQSSATKELTRQGLTRQTTESVEDANRRRAREQEAARNKAEEDKKAVDQRRQDSALLETYANEKEIDLKRDRDLGVLDLQLEQLTTGLKAATVRYTDVKGRHDQAEKGKGGASPALKEELKRASADKERLEKAIDTKQKEKEETRKRYAEYRKRYSELKSGQALSGQVSAPVSKPVSAPVAAKK